ncbi:hypothetical protein CK203_009398 [Vitis vinifera]|uniref:PWWP domain-containing protein n=1 Tax=Vitis vinifera TaxID=29760 RepID=A0A438JSU2_VITVI|nr:hypothetical protein CK203_009398 [Vitis vinifera]
MAKKKENVIRIDHIPKSCRQPRSHPRRRRTSPPSSQLLSMEVFITDSFVDKGTEIIYYFLNIYTSGSLLRSSSSKDTLSSVSIASLDDRMEKRTEMAKLPLIKCNNSEDKGLCSDVYEIPIDEVESVVQGAHFDSGNDRTFDEQKDDNAATLDFMPIKSQVMESSGAFTNPGSVVWAKTACQVWWPAEVMEEKSTDSRNQGIDGHVLVQYYGNHHSAWVDPDRDLSLFEDCFEERSCNPMEDFQDALKQALHRKRHLNSCRQLVGSPDGPDNLHQQDQSSGTSLVISGGLKMIVIILTVESVVGKHRWLYLPANQFQGVKDGRKEKCISSCSSRTEDDSIERGRGKRKRKPKVHFDAVALPLKPARKVRRFRIMRYLGLIAPVGSPFSLAHARIASK